MFINQTFTPANAFSYTFGTIAALIMGSGMSLVMALFHYPLYLRIPDAHRKNGDRIIRLSEEIMAE